MIIDSKPFNCWIFHIIQKEIQKIRFLSFSRFPLFLPLINNLIDNSKILFEAILILFFLLKKEIIGHPLSEKESLQLVFDSGNDGDVLFEETDDFGLEGVVVNLKGGDVLREEGLGHYF
jgi:hypothetical protein